MNYFCCEETRRNAVKTHPSLNGIDYIEVLDRKGDPYEKRQTTLIVHLLKPFEEGNLLIKNVLIEGGERIKNIKVKSLSGGFSASVPTTDAKARLLIVEVEEAGDFSSYKLRLLKDKTDQQPLDKFDPVLSAVDFCFKVLCPNEFDCKQDTACEPIALPTPEINYLAKDYESFRRLLLDRMALLNPSWKEKNPSDIGITLIELLAYTADYVSYQQDSIATEAYLGTARKRVSVRRHARMVDYHMHDGCNARTWVHIKVAEGVSGLMLEKGSGKNKTKLLSKVKDCPVVSSVDSIELQYALAQKPEVFELMHDVELYNEHNKIFFYTWGSRDCCLPKGATSATLLGNFPYLKSGQVLLLKEILGPQSGALEDANPLHCHPVLLTEVKASSDPLGAFAEDLPEDIGLPSPGTALGLTEIRWQSEDALPFSLCISSRSGDSYHKNMSVVLGNIVLADHGTSFEDEEQSSLLPNTVPFSKFKYAPTEKHLCEEDKHEVVPVRYTPQLRRGPITQAAPFDPQKLTSAKGALHWSLRDALPEITLMQQTTLGETVFTEDWKPKRDLLNSLSTAKHFVVETESDGVSSIRFGDSKNGASPVSGSVFKAIYRTGNGTSGNIGPRTLQHLVCPESWVSNYPDKIIEITNVLPGKGGTDAESIESVMQSAPSAFRTQARAVTQEDYETLSKTCAPSIQRTVCKMRWTGSWRTAFVSVDRFGAEEVDESFEGTIRQCLEKYRMAGQDLEINGPVYVSLELEMNICIKKSYFASDVKAAILAKLSNKILKNGTRGIFHPDVLTFGQTIYLSPIYAAIHSVQGVDSVQIIKFNRRGESSSKGLEKGYLTFATLEIPRLDSDPNFPERGNIHIHVING